MDPRIARTRTRLEEAVLELARTRTVDEMTVGEIVQQAGVNRSSFYQHYPDKETLLADALEHLIAAHLPEDPGSIAEHEPDGVCPEVLLPFLEHITENVGLYRAVMGPHSSAVVTRRLQEFALHLLGDTRLVARRSEALGLPADVVSASLAGAVQGVLTVWVFRDPMPAVSVAADWLGRVLSRSDGQGRSTQTV